MSLLSKDKLINEIKKEEGVVKHNSKHILYFDHLGKPTIGHGRLLMEGGGLSNQEADLLLENDIKHIILEMDNRMLWWRGESDVRKRALINMAYQLGVGGLMGFKRMLWACQHGRYKEAAEEALDSKWAKQTPARARRIANMLVAGYDDILEQGDKK